MSVPLLNLRRVRQQEGAPPSAGSSCTSSRRLCPPPLSGRSPMPSSGARRSSGALSSDIDEVAALCPAAIDDAATLRARLADCQRLLVALDRRYSDELERKERRVAALAAALAAAESAGPPPSPRPPPPQRSLGTQATATAPAGGGGGRGVGLGATPRRAATPRSPHTAAPAFPASPRGPYYPSTAAAAVRFYTRAVQAALPLGAEGGGGPASVATTPRSPPASARGLWAPPPRALPAPAAAPPRHAAPSTPRATFSATYAAAHSRPPGSPGRPAAGSSSRPREPGRVAAAWSPHQYRPATRRVTTPRSYTPRS